MVTELDVLNAMLCRGRNGNSFSTPLGSVSVEDMVVAAIVLVVECDEKWLGADG